MLMEGINTKECDSFPNNLPYLGFQRTASAQQPNRRCFWALPQCGDSKRHPPALVYPNLTPPESVDPPPRNNKVACSRRVALQAPDSLSLSLSLSLLLLLLFLSSPLALGYGRVSQCRYRLFPCPTSNLFSLARSTLRPLLCCLLWADVPHMPLCRHMTLRAPAWRSCTLCYAVPQIFFCIVPAPLGTVLFSLLALTFVSSLFRCREPLTSNKFL